MWYLSQSPYKGFNSGVNDMTGYPCKSQSPYKGFNSRLGNKVYELDGLSQSPYKGFNSFSIKESEEHFMFYQVSIPL